MTCADGTNSFMGMDVVVDYACRVEGDAGEEVVETQALIRASGAAITVSSLVKVRSFGAWESDLPSFEAPNVDDGCGSLNRMRKGCGRSNPPWTAVIEYEGSEYPIEALIGAEGTIRRWMPDGAYREAYGWIAGATVIPSHVPGEENLAELRVQWQGGKLTDPGFVKMYNAADVEQFPVMPP